MSNEIIIGIDPGYAITGYGIIEKSGNKLTMLDCGVISTKPTSQFPDRLLAINTRIATLIEFYKPKYMAVEELFLGQNKTTAIGTAQARGVVLVEAARANIPVYEFTPGQIKLAVTGYGKADKNQVSQMVVRLLGLKEMPKPDDACDGLAVAICLANTGVPFSERAVSGYQYGRYGKREWL
ncbi:MAG: crossover junction endodeoxyribonuclease RuvC [Clostridia bacterium]|nr:crossover junction endodeoxyribonuclease RuvC [Clostridia bacterium]